MPRWRDQFGSCGQSLRDSTSQRKQARQRGVLSPLHLLTKLCSGGRRPARTPGITCRTSSAAWWMASGFALGRHTQHLKNRTVNKLEPAALIHTLINKTLHRAIRNTVGFCIGQFARLWDAASANRQYCKTLASCYAMCNAPIHICQYCETLHQSHGHIALHPNARRTWRPPTKWSQHPHGLCSQRTVPWRPVDHNSSQNVLLPLNRLPLRKGHTGRSVQPMHGTMKAR